MRVLLWHVHGSWTTALVQGRHEYLLPVEPGRGPDGRGRARTWDWPEAAIEVRREEARDADVDVVLVQRPHELDGLARAWLGDRRPPTVYVEHNAPQGRIAEMRHPAADRDDVDVVVHVTHFNDLFWDCGGTPTRVVEHGVVDPGYRYSGETARAAVVINEAPRRGRVTGTDLLDRFVADGVPIDLFGMKARDVTAPVTAVDDIPQERLHDELARRRVYLHPIRWTSLGLSLIEAMHLGMPVVALATTEAPEAVRPEAGVISTCVERLTEAVHGFLAEPGRAREAGVAARRCALERFGLQRFLDDWDDVLAGVAR
jgi:glycosyltransferase involved in cell wall biosynthesis